MLEMLKQVNWLNVAVNYGPWAVSAVLAVIALLIRRAKGKDQILGIARTAFFYVEQIARMTPGKVDDKLVEGLRVALALADGDLDAKKQALIADEFSRLAAEMKRSPSLALQPNNSVKIN